MIYTAQDVVDHLLTTTAGGAQDGEHRAVRQAVVHGVRDVLQSRQWLWHTKTNSFVTQQASTTATFVQGSADVTVASADGFVPGRLMSAPAQFYLRQPRIAAVNGNIVTLDQPARESGSAVMVLPQTYYDLPPDLKELDVLISDTVGTLHCYITPVEWQRLEINAIGSAEPYYYTIMRSDLYPDRYQVRFVGVPTNGTAVHYTYRYIPKPIKYMGYEQSCRRGTVTATQDPATLAHIVTGSGTEFPLDCTGSAIRFGTTTEEADPIGSLSPYLHQRIIRAVSSPTLLTIDAALSTPSNIKYAITDIIDASPQMYTAILSGAEMWYSRLTNKNANEALVVFSRDLRLAMETDQVSPSAVALRGVTPTARSLGWNSIMLPDVS